ncbi:hypothetical protein HY994_05960 [Candidatus Micrarchaeota archaeon]|nr:hypothetical protein [Candidatus Micrarchaeota archaeon]
MKIPLKTDSQQIQMTMLPQEIEVWYVLPALRCQMAKSFLEQGLSQKQTARTLGITEAAVSQYVHSKRAQNVEFSDAFKAKIKAACSGVSLGKQTAYDAVQYLVRDFKESKQLCDLHHSLEGVPLDCDSCMEKTG